MRHSTAISIVLVEVDSGASPDELANEARAHSIQLARDFGPIWNVTASCRVQTPDHPLQDWEWPHYMHDEPTKTDPNGALAYHDRMPDGRPVSNTFRGLTKRYGDAPSQSAGHENLEMIIDEMLNEGCQDENGTWWAKEVCDPCEQIGYEIECVMMTDFVRPEWFARSKLGEPSYNFLGTIDQPFGVLDGGYAQKFDPQSGWQQVGMMRGARSELARLGLSRGSKRRLLQCVARNRTVSGEIIA